MMLILIFPKGECGGNAPLSYPLRCRLNISN